MPASISWAAAWAKRRVTPRGSVEAARRAVAAAPAWSVAVTELAMALARANQFAEALSTAEKAVQLDPNNPALLARVIDVAHRAQHVDLALAWLRRAAAIAPGNPDLQRLIARDLRLKHQYAESLEVYNALLDAAPDDAVAHLGRLQTALALGDSELARTDSAALLQSAPDNPEYRFWDDVAHGRTPAHQPAPMVQSLYEGFAPLYDQHVVGSLKYDLPRTVGDRILQWHPDRVLNVLDLGCGTGLLGAYLGRLQGAMVGVDLSRPMIDQALRHNLYDRIHNVDLREALEATPESLYEVIAALDVFIYAGDLSRAIPDAHRILKPGGRLVFSCETAPEDGPDLVLNTSTMRYAHKRSAVEALCRAAGFASVEVEPLKLREEDRVPVDGFLVVARKA
jgi:predicted TPR repeat methyltransferase